ncbi:unnamed protein product [Rhizoctonia solani]|uniref:Uncharacterized protein n=1 Tax=Rhizoctonia solani TaxID=456999 RepID=A0A8H2WUU8_9AGAM|nr:unnamed protein product [Rhizoctonia solani]
MAHDRPRIQTRVPLLSHPNSPCHSAPVDGSPIALTSGIDPFITRSRLSGRSNANKRRQALLALLEELSELKEEVEIEKKQEVYPTIEDDRTYSNTEGIEKFRAFDDCISLLVLKLQTFANAVRQLASSAGLLNATNYLMCRLPRIQRQFQDNASMLFDIITRTTDVTVNSSSGHRRRANSKRQSTGEALRQNAQPVEISTFPSELEQLAEDLETFVHHLNDVPEFIDESVHTTHGAVNVSVTAFAKDLRYRASCLKEFQDRLMKGDKVIAGHINDLTEDLVSHAVCVRDALNAFIEVTFYPSPIYFVHSSIIEIGVPAIRYSQQRMATSLQNLSTVATFFSGVTATTLQFRYICLVPFFAPKSRNFHQIYCSFEDHGSLLPDLVNALWITSLVFSIASAINAQLAYHWRAAMYRSPKCYVPWWVSIWIVSTPLFFLVVSSAAFSIGLCVFTYSSEQSPAVRALVTYFTVATSSGLLFVGIWFAFERWTFVATNGSRWLLDILEERVQDLWKSATSSTLKPISATTRSMRRALITLHQFSSRLLTHIRSLMKIGSRSRAARARLSDMEAPLGQDGATCSEFDSPMVMPIINIGNGGSPCVNHYSEKRRPPNSSKDNAITENGLLLQVQDTRPSNTVVDRGIIDPSGINLPPQNARFKAVVRRVINMLKITPHPWPGYWANFSPPIDLMPSSSGDQSQNEFIPQRIRTYVPMLRTFHPCQLLNKHLGLVKHLQFSPNGQFLATCSWDRTALIWKVGPGPSMVVELMHSLVRNDQIGGLVTQVAWSPGGDQLLTRQRKCIRLWIPKARNLIEELITRVCWRTILRERDVQSITWMPRSSSKFISVEWNTGPCQTEMHTCQLENIKGSNLVVIQAGGGVEPIEITYYLERLQVWDVKVMPDEERVVCVATLLQSRTNDQPINSRYEKRILIYNFRTMEVESQVPLLQDVRDIALTALGNYALVSYENKAPPQTWRIDEVDELQEDGSRLKKCQLTTSQSAKLSSAYIAQSQNPVDFAGPSFFGGPKDTFVVAASRAGEIYIWERSSAILLHTLTMSSNKELTSLAWNRKSPNQFMLAAAARDGTIRMWRTRVSPPSITVPPEETESVGPSPATSNFLPGSFNPNHVRFQQDL